jgi:hypothetical protein
MKHFPNAKREYYVVFFWLYLFAISAVSVQDYVKRRQERLNRLDLSDFAKTLFLNAGVTNQHEVDHFKALSQNRISQNKQISSVKMNTDLSPIHERMPDLNKLIERNPNRLRKVI